MLPHLLLANAFAPWRPSQVLMNEGAGGESQVQTRWKYYRMDPKAFLAMGA